MQIQKKKKKIYGLKEMDETSIAESAIKKTFNR